MQEVALGKVLRYLPTRLINPGKRRRVCTDVSKCSSKRFAKLAKVGSVVEGGD